MMYEQFLSQYNEILEDIAMEDTYHSMDMMFSSVRPTEREKEKFHEKSLISLLCIKIGVEIQLIECGQDKYREELYRDIQDAILYGGKILDHANEQVVICGYVVDILCLIWPRLEQSILLYVEQVFPNILKYKGPFSIDSDFYRLIQCIISQYQQAHQEALCNLLIQLRYLSASRNSVFSDEHRKIVVQNIYYANVLPQLICILGEIDEENMESINDAWSGDFFYFYAMGLAQMQEIKKSRKYFAKSYEIRKKLYGEDSWYTAVARRDMLFVREPKLWDREDIEFCSEYINKLDKGIYSAYLTEVAGDVIKVSTLYNVLNYCLEKISMKQYEQYLHMYEKLCDKYNVDKMDEVQQVSLECNDDYVRMKDYIHWSLVFNLMGNYNMRIGNVIEAEQYYLKALTISQKGSPSPLLSEEEIKVNLLIIYMIQNDRKNGIPLLNSLFHSVATSRENLDDRSMQKRYTIFSVKVICLMNNWEEYDEETLEYFKREIEYIYLDMRKNGEEFIKYADKFILFVERAIALLVNVEYVNQEEIRKYLELLFYIEQHEEEFGLRSSVRLQIFYRIIANLLWHLQDPREFDYIKKSINIYKQEKFLDSVESGIFITAAEYCGKNSKKAECLYYIKEELNELTRIWQNSVRYCNDKRLQQVLFPSQQSFSVVYAMLRKQENLELAYESVLRFKSLASLAGRERNKVLHQNSVNGALLKKIRKLQNEIADMEAMKLFQNISVSYEQQSKKLRNLEAEFARKFPNYNNFEEITWDRVCEAIPDNTTVIEYFLGWTDYKLKFQELDSKMKNLFELDIYITTKIDGKCNLKRVTVSDAYKILIEGHLFVKKMQEFDLDEIESLRQKLYEKLVAPVLPYIGDVDTLYLAPDGMMINLPLELLYDEKKKLLADRYNIIRMECARDFLFANSGVPNNGKSLIIGNPSYEVEECDNISSREKDSFSCNINLSEKDITPLLFSEVEVKKIGARLHSAVYTKKKASKQLLMNAQGYRNIHIATHGFFDLGNNTDILYSSFLLFAGAKDWIKTGQLSEFYGNGIITADEISHLNLKTVKVMVLSSCLSGMSKISIDKNLQGMIGALSVAGVQYVITHLWKVDDFSTAILMDIFYKEYIENKQEPPVALNLAKEQLKNISVGELRRQGWFEYVKQGAFDEEIKYKIMTYEKYPDRAKLFQNEMYWGGFICYRCN